MTHAAAEKVLLRRQLRDRWQGLPQPGAVTTELLSYVRGLCESEPEESATTVVAGFIRHGHEVDVEPLLNEVKAWGFGIALPRVTGDEISFMTWDANSLAEGPYGLLEPVDAAASSIEHMRVVLVPAMACSTDGVRLGRGGGYYDRALSRMPVSARFICIVSDDAVMPAGSIPREDHDVRMHVIATPTRVLTV